MSTLHIAVLLSALGDAGFRQDQTDYELKALGAYVQLRVTGQLSVKDPIDAGRQVLSDYGRHSGASIHWTHKEFELFLGDDATLPKRARELNGKPATVQGQLIIVHPPMNLSEFDGRYLHLNPRYVIKVKRLDGYDDKKKDNSEPSAKIEIKGVLGPYGHILRMDGKKGTLADVFDRKATLGAAIRSWPCGFQIHLPKDEWIRLAQELSDSTVVIEGKLDYVPRFQSLNSNQFFPEFYFVQVTKLRPVGPNKRGEDKR